MFLSVSFLQAIGEEVISEAMPVLDSASSPVQTRTYMVSLAALLIVNVVVMLLNFVFDRMKHRKDNHNHKVHLIAQKGVEVESSVYDQFQQMASLHPGDEHALLDAILSLDSYLNTNRLYIEKKYHAYSIEFLDYFKRIQHKMTLKDIKKEEQFFEKLSKAFYGE